MKDWKSMFHDGMDIVESLGIEIEEITHVELNYRAKSRFGQCKHHGDGTHEINFNYLIFNDNANDDAIMSTIIHEILHACKGCHGHNGKWKRLAKLVTNKTRYNISRCSNYESFGIARPMQRTRQNNPNYVFRCDGCGAKVIRQRKSDFVKNTNLYSCRRCGGKFHFIPSESLIKNL